MVFVPIQGSQLIEVWFVWFLFFIFLLLFPIAIFLAELLWQASIQLAPGVPQSQHLMQPQLICPTAKRGGQVTEYCRCRCWRSHESWPFSSSILSNTLPNKSEVWSLNSWKPLLGIKTLLCWDLELDKTNWRQPRTISSSLSLDIALGQSGFRLQLRQKSDTNV